MVETRVHFWWTKWHWGRFSLSIFAFPCQHHSSHVLNSFMTDDIQDDSGGNINILEGDNIGHCGKTS
jgi:hypothetical protein